MGNEVLCEIKEFIIQKLQSHYGYCGVAEGQENCMINSDDKNGNDIIINIKTKPE